MDSKIPGLIGRICTPLTVVEPPVVVRIVTDAEPGAVSNGTWTTTDS